MKLALQVLTQYSNFDNVIRNIQNKLVNRALKSDQKSTAKSRNFLELPNSLNPNVQKKSHFVTIFNNIIPRFTVKISALFIYAFLPLGVTFCTVLLLHKRPRNPTNKEICWTDNTDYHETNYMMAVALPQTQS